VTVKTLILLTIYQTVHPSSHSPHQPIINVAPYAKWLITQNQTQRNVQDEFLICRKAASPVTQMITKYVHPENVNIINQENHILDEISSSHLL